MSSHVGYTEYYSKRLCTLEYGILGSSSGFVTRAVLQPLDVLKIRLQLQVEPTFGKNKGIFYGIINTTKTIVSNEGIKAMWKGHISAQALTVSYSFGQFYSYKLLTKYAVENGHGGGSYVQAWSGALAGMCGTLISMPFDIARTRIVAQGNATYKNFLDVWKKIIKFEGRISLWKGTLPTLALTMPMTAIQFRTYHALTDVFLPIFAAEGVSQDSTHGRKTLVYTACGSVAGFVAKFIVYPFDVLKKRMQMREVENIRKRFGKVVKYTGLFDCIIKITREEGLLAWYKGILPSLLKAALFSGLCFASFELSSMFLFQLKSQGSDDDNR